MERSGYSCPACKRETGDTNEILAGGGYLQCSKIQGHRWNDSEKFMSEGPRIEFKQAKQAAAPQSNHTNVNVSIPVGVYNVLLERFGDRLSATLAGQLHVLSEGTGMILSETDMDRLAMTLPERPKNGSHLVGLVYALSQQVQDQKNIADSASEALKGYEGLQPTKVLVDLGANMEYAKGRAADDKQPVSLWLAINLKNALESQWF